MRILHISDFHIDKNDRNDSINHIVTPLLNTIEEIQNENPIDLVLITGDLINKGGENYSTVAEAYQDFIDILINPLLAKTNLDKNRIFFVPGNHDIVRSADHKAIEVGLIATLVTEEEVNKHILKPIGNERIKEFKTFENIFYTDISIEKLQSDFHSCYKISLNEEKIGIACLNSAWRCYDSKEDKNKILIGEKQITDSIDFLSDCKIKIALSHHHFDWLAEFDGEMASEYLSRNFHLFFCGHSHRNKAYYYQDPDGQLFTFCAPGILSPSSRKSEKNYENGFTIIDYNLSEAKIKAIFKKAEYPKQSFITNTSIGNGIWETAIPVGDEIKKLIEEQQLIKQIRKETLPKINGHLISYSTETSAPKTIDDIFVMPNISVKNEYDAEKDDKLVTDISEIIISDKNFILFGTKESGKTILLGKILLDSIECNKRCHQIPAAFDFREFKSEIQKEIKDFWGKSADETRKIIQDNKILLLIDNISFDDEDKYKLKKLAAFLKENKNVRFIGTYQQLFEDDFPVNLELVSLLEFEKLTIKQFKSKQIRLLIRKWFPNSDKYDTPKKMETLTNAFLALNLPRTPFAVSMFLWIIEKQENYKPINNSTLIENFIEKLLNKHDEKEALREKFSYENKLWILSEVAYKMLNDENVDYSLPYATFVTYVDTYLNAKRFEDFETSKIVTLLLESGIFLKENGNVRFRFSCFFEFFLVKRMENDAKFKEDVLLDSNYLNFINEIDYYTGLNRGDTKLLKLIIQRLDVEFKELSDLIESKRIEKGYRTIDDFFTSKDEKGVDKPSLVSQLDEKKVMRFLPDNKPTEEDIEVFEDKKLELKKEEKGISKKQKGNKIQELSKLLVLALRVVKNSEEVSIPVHELKEGEIDTLKYDSYTTVLRNSISFAILHKAVFELFLSNKDKLPKTKVEEFVMMDRLLPLLHQILLFENIGTLKLSSVIREKITNDRKMPVSEFEKFLSVFIYADIRAKEYDKIISDFIKEIKKGFIEDMSFFKLVTYYFYRSKDDEMDNFYLNLIADLMIQSKGYDKSRKSKIMEDYKNKKRERAIQLKLFE